MKKILLLMPAVVFLCLAPAFAADTLADWVHSFTQPETQRKILDRIFPDQIGPTTTAVKDKHNGSYFFTYNGGWARLGGDYVFGSTDTTKSPYLIVTCMTVHAVDEEPISATSYLFRDTFNHPVTLTGGYATHERMHLVKLPKLSKSFLVVEDSVASPQGAMRQWTAFLLEVESSGINDHPRNVWTSPPTLHSFQLGFVGLHSDNEMLVVRTVPSPNKSAGYGSDSMTSSDTTPQYAAYRWSGDRFEADTSVFESQLKDLPDNTWKYGTGR